VFYVGATGCLEKRIQQHKNNEGSSFTAKYKCYYLVYFESYNKPRPAFLREKQLKNWHRKWKINLIKQENPNMIDLAADWFH